VGRPRKNLAEAPEARRSLAAAAGLPAKLARPKLARIVVRPRLLRLLGRKSSAPVTWVHAPAGAGKTYLLASFLEARAPAPSLWYEVDASDRDVSSMFHHARLAAEHLVGRALDLPSWQPGVGLAEFVRRFFARLFGSLPAGTTVVFDNYQEAAPEPAWQLVFRELLGARPPHVRICVGSRQAPPAALSRFRVAGTMELLGFDLLKFGKGEVETLLRSRGGRRDESAALLRSTDGWAVALSLLTGALTEAGMPARKAWRPGGPRSRAGMTQIFDFMAAEILGMLSEESRTFLLEVALVPSFSEATAAALTGRTNVATLIDRLERDQLLIDRHEDGLYRLHDLLRRFLLEHGERHQAPADRRTLKAAAAHVLAGTNLEVACALLGESGRWDDAVRLIEAKAPELASQGRMATLAAAIERVPPGPRQGHPWLVLWLAAARFAQPDEALTLAERAFHELRAVGDVAGELLAWAFVVQSMVMAGNDFRELRRWMATKRDLPPGTLPPALATRVAFAELVAFAYYGVDEEKDLGQRARIEAALAVVEQHGSVEEKGLAYTSAGLLAFFGGDLARTEQLLANAKALLTRVSYEPLPHIILSHATLLMSFMAQGRFRDGERLLLEALALGEKEGILAFHSSLLVLGAGAMLSVGDHPAGLKILARLNASPPPRSRLARTERSFLDAWMALEGDDHAAFGRALDECARECQQLGFHYGFAQTLFGRLIGASLARDEAAIHLAIADVEQYLKVPRWTRLQAEGELTLAFAKLGLGELSPEELRSAMARGRAASIMAWSFCGPRVVDRLVKAALAQGIEVEYATKLLTAYELEPDDEALLLPTWPWPLRVRVLGTTELELEGRRVPFGRKLPTVPLALLKLLSAGRPLSSSKVAAALWPGLARDARPGVLHTAVYRLRKLLGREDAIRSQGGDLCLDPSVCWTDVRAFELVCDRIDALAAPEDRSAGTPATGSPAFLRATLAELYRGPFADESDPQALRHAAEVLERRLDRARARVDVS
jgi:LuxR family transcriptional regulator, maltose regulon positive regulatory protein